MSDRTVRLRRLGLVVVGVVSIYLLAKAVALKARGGGEERSYSTTRRIFRRLNPAAVWAIEHLGVGAHNGVLHHKGRKSGLEYATPLCMVATPVGYISPASFGSHTDWLLNLKANPQSRVVVDKVSYETIAEVITVEQAIGYAGGGPGCECWNDPNLKELVLLRPRETQPSARTA